MNKLLPTVALAISLAVAPFFSAQAQGTSQFSEETVSAGDSAWLSPGGDAIPLQTMSWSAPQSAFGATGTSDPAASAGTGESGQQRNAEQTRSHDEHSYTNQVQLASRPNLAPTFFGKLTPGGLPPTRLDSLVRDAGGAAELIYGDEGTWDIPPYFSFTEDHRIINGIPGGLTTGHQSGLPEAWGFPN